MAETPTELVARLRTASRAHNDHVRLCADTSLGPATHAWWKAYWAAVTRLGKRTNNVRDAADLLAGRTRLHRLIVVCREDGHAGELGLPLAPDDHPGLEGVALGLVAARLPRLAALANEAAEQCDYLRSKQPRGGVS